MSENGYQFVEWREHFVSQERGNRIVHYFLKDSGGESILAVVGTERSVRHMFYVVSDEFVQLYGPESAIYSGFKWRSRREVVDWLTSMLSKQHKQGLYPKSLACESLQSLGASRSPVNEGTALQAQTPDNMEDHSNNLALRNLDIVWSGTAWTCGKKLTHYPAFCRNGTTIGIHSFVFVMGKGEDHYVAYLEDMYEDRRGQRKVKVRWFHHTEEVKGSIPLRNPHPKEIFITPYSQVISAECVDGPATVLTREHYEESFATFPHSFLTRVHMCCRQFRGNKVKPFDLNKLHGYFDQPIISCLSSSPSSGPDLTTHGLEDGEPSDSKHVKRGGKRTRSERIAERFEDRSEIKVPGNGYQMKCESPYKKIRFGLSGKRLFSHKYSERQPWYSTVFKVDERIELLCQDSGLRGCWFRCTVLQISRKKIKVRYDDLQDEDECGNLEEWVPAFKLAMPDKVGMRYSGRLTIRPTPPNYVQTDSAFEVGTAVDAWWSDGWWEGVVTGTDSCDADKIQLYFPGENISLNMDKKKVRISKDWIGDSWIDIEAEPNILSLISIAINHETKVSTSSTEVKSDNVDINSTETKVGANLNTVDEETENPDLVTLANSSNHLQAKDHLSNADHSNGTDSFVDEKGDIQKCDEKTKGNLEGECDLPVLNGEAK